MRRGSNRKDGEKSQKGRESNGEVENNLGEKKHQKRDENGWRKSNGKIGIMWRRRAKKKKKTNGRGVGKKWLTLHKKRLANLIANSWLLCESNS